MLEFNSQHLASPNSYVYRRSQEDGEARTKWFKEDPVLFWPTEVGTVGKDIALIHGAPSGLMRSHVIQILDEDMKVKNTPWADSVPSTERKPF